MGNGNWQIHFLSLASEASPRRGGLIFSPSEIAASGALHMDNICSELRFSKRLPDLSEKLCGIGRDGRNSISPTTAFVLLNRWKRHEKTRNKFYCVFFHGVF